MTEPREPGPSKGEPPAGARPGGQPADVPPGSSPDVLALLAMLGRGVVDVGTEIGRDVSSGLRSTVEGLTGSAHSPIGDWLSGSRLPGSTEVVLLRQALRSLQAVGRATGFVSPKEATAAIDRLRQMADDLRREGINPTLGIVNLVGDCLEGLEVLVTTEVVPFPVELEELRLALLRLRRPEIRLALSLPAERGRAPLAGRLVRGLIEEAPGLAESSASLAELERAVVEATKGAIERTRRSDPAAWVELVASLRSDLLAIDLSDGSLDRSTAERGSAPGWDEGLARQSFDSFEYAAPAAGSRGTLRLRRRLSLWQHRRAGW